LPVNFWRVVGASDSLAVSMALAEQKLWRWIALATACFAALTVTVHVRALDRFDYVTTVWLNAHGNRLLDWVMSIITATATPELSLVVAAGLTIFLWRRFGWRPAVCLFGMFTAGIVLEVIFKNWVVQPGPHGMIHRYVFGPGLIHVALPYAYPSGHALRALLLGGAIALWVMPRAAAFWWTLGGLVGISRLYLGHHWTTDVIGGTLLAAALLMVIDTQIQPREKTARQAH
jgi:membrane-associated phospholipid phosphatase